MVLQHNLSKAHQSSWVTWRHTKPSGVGIPPQQVPTGQTADYLPTLWSPWSFCYSLHQADPSYLPCAWFPSGLLCSSHSIIKQACNWCGFSGTLSAQPSGVQLSHGMSNATSLSSSFLRYVPLFSPTWLLCSRPNNARTLLVSLPIRFPPPGENILKTWETFLTCHVCEDTNYRFSLILGIALCSGFREEYKGSPFPSHFHPFPLLLVLESIFPQWFSEGEEG